MATNGLVNENEAGKREKMVDGLVAQYEE